MIREYKMNFKNRMSLAAAIAVCITSPVASAQDDDHNHLEHTSDEIIVSALPIGLSIEEIAQPISVLYGDELERKQSASIGEILASEPGVHSSYYGPVASRPVIRGQYGERVAVLSNGLDSLDVSALSEDHQVTVEGLLADRIEIIRGPATLLYGSGAAGGLVNVVDYRLTDQAPEKLFSGAAAVGTDSAIAFLGQDQVR